MGPCRGIASALIIEPEIENRPDSEPADTYLIGRRQTGQLVRTKQMTTPDAAPICRQMSAKITEVARTFQANRVSAGFHWLDLHSIPYIPNKPRATPPGREIQRLI